MGLEIPDLDDREYAVILADAIERIPVRSDEWTDHNVHDPGITILELLAWVIESDGYRLDRVTDVHRRKYLKLLGERPAPPEPASVRLVLAPPEGGSGAEVRAGAKLAVDDRSGTEKVFETAAPVTLTRARIERIVSEHREGTTDNSEANRTDGMHFLAFGPEAEVGSTMYVGFAGDPFAGEETDSLDISVDFHEANLPAPATHSREDTTFEPSVGVSWEYLKDYRLWREEDSWADLTVRRDETNHFYQGGTVTLSKPEESDGWTPEAWNVEDSRPLDQDPGFYWLRCTVIPMHREDTANATGEGPEPCEESTTAEREDLGYEIPPQLNSLRLNVVEASHRSRTHGQALQRVDDDGADPGGSEETTAWPGQTFAFERSPVLETTARGERGRVLVGEQVWEEVEDFDASGPDDAHYVLDQSRGTIRFGDEIRGKVPDAGQRVMAQTYTYGGGTDGNVSPSSSWTFLREMGIYTYYCDPHRSRGMKGGIVVDPSDGGDEPSEPDYGKWFDDVDNYQGTVDETGSEEVTIEVGDVGNGGSFAFSPPAVRVDPGTTVRFEWVSDGHNVVVEEQPPGGRWPGHGAIEDAGFAFAARFASSIDLRAVGVVSAGHALGGTDAESVESALARLKRDLKVPYRTVTPNDYRYVATHTPRLRFGRAKAVVASAEDVGGPDCEEQNAVRVVVVPFGTRPRPSPSNGFLEAVRRHLQRHRLLTDRVTVEPPVYVGISVQAEVGLLPGYSPSGRVASVEAALNAFLNPLEGYDGEGWPFGRPVYASEIYEVIESVDGIDCVVDVSVTARGRDADDSGGDVLIGATALVYPEDHDVIARTGRDVCKEGR